MSITDVIDFIKGLGVTVPVYPYAFPVNSSKHKEALTVEFASSGTLMDNTLTITVRAEDAIKGEVISQDLIDKLHNLTDQSVGDKNFIMVQSLQLLPPYLGKSNGYHYYMNNFKVLAD